MISAPNRRPPLNGNKLLLLVSAVLWTLISSCSAAKKSTAAPKEPVPAEIAKEVYNPRSGRYEPATPSNTRVDTVHWTRPAEAWITDEDLMTVGADEASVKSAYRIAVLLPLSDDDLNKDLNAEGSDKFFHYYAGMKMGMEDMAIQYPNIRVDVLDVNANPYAMQPILQSAALQQADLLVGPLRRDHLNEAARFSLQKDIPIAAPWNAFRTIENINPNYILLRSSLPTHCEALTRYLLENFNGEEICLLGRERFKPLMNYFQSFLTEFKGPLQKPFREILIKDDFRFGDDYQYLDSTKKVYIVTEYEDPNVVFNLLRHINLMRNNRPVTVIGMPSWQDYGTDFINLFSQLGVTISASSHPDYSQEKVNEFKKLFFRRYQTFPLKEAFEGYDAIQYLVQRLASSGRKFHLQEDLQTYDGLASSFRLEKVINTQEPVDDRLRNVICVENKALHILRFEEFRFNIIR
ncbi:MAG TPA: hypothetical protein PKM27_04570 [Saprospiraceae bacterium]|nr:hypothetical protein [Saprospiraceae bacterium]HNT19319.1 hypothetical protein [Saprospiraceae bacterium]